MKYAVGMFFIAALFVIALYAFDCASETAMWSFIVMACVWAVGYLVIGESKRRL